MTQCYLVKIVTGNHDSPSLYEYVQRVFLYQEDAANFRDKINQDLITLGWHMKHDTANIEIAWLNLEEETPDGVPQYNGTTIENSGAYATYEGPFDLVSAFS